MSREDFIAQVARQSRNTVGYREASSQKAFSDGATVAAGLAYDTLMGQIQTLTQDVAARANQAEAAEGDLRTLSRIINQYKED